jgi:lysophospholipase L1-like esterase
VNAGVSGETTVEMLARLRRDVLQARPELVVWQTGTNDAIKGVPLETFSRALVDGLAEMRAQSIPVVVVDQQDLMQGKSHDFDKYVSVMRSIADQGGVTLLHRYRVMRYLSQHRRGGLRSLLAKDGLHMNDYTHRCIGELLAAGIGRIFG